VFLDEENVPTRFSESSMTDVYATLIGSIDAVKLNRLYQLVIANSKIKSSDNFHLLIQSIGGEPSAAHAIYDLLQHSGLKVNTYNAGSIQSGAVIVFCAGSVRTTSPNAYFMIHETYRPMANNLTVGAAESLAKQLTLDNAIQLKVYKNTFNFTDESLPKEDWFIDGHTALSIGLAQNLGSFAVPAGTDVIEI
jgi:ATP-dependent protease ClpP protease subunit